MRQITCGIFFVLAASAGEAASTWYVKADAAAGGDGSRSRPFATLEQVETRSQPGDTIRILPSLRPLDGGIQLKYNQRLIGLGDPVTKVPAGSARPTITNTSSARHNGDAIRLATNVLVQNIHIDGAARSGFFGVNPSNGVYNLSISDSVFANTNPAGGLDGHIRFSGASSGLKALTLNVRNSRFSGFGGAVQILSTANVDTLNVLVENSSL